MDELYRLLVIRFNYLTARCLFPIILNWQKVHQAKYEMEVMEKIIKELEHSMGVTNVRIDYNMVDYLPNLQAEFNGIIGDINFNTETSQLRTLNVDKKIFLPMSEIDYSKRIFQKFTFRQMHFPVRVLDPERITLQEMLGLPLLVIE